MLCSVGHNIGENDLVKYTKNGFTKKLKRLKIYNLYYIIVNVNIIINILGGNRL